MGRASKHNNHLSHENEIPEVRHTVLWKIDNGVLKQRGEHPLYLVRVWYGTLSGQSVPRYNHDRWTMGKQRFPAIYLHPGQWPHKGHQYPHEKQSLFVHNKIVINFLPHTRTQQHRTTKADPKQTMVITYNLLTIATALKWSPREEIPRHFSYTLRSNMAI